MITIPIINLDFNPDFNPMIIKITITSKDSTNSLTIHQGIKVIIIIVIMEIDMELIAIIIIVRELATAQGLQGDVSSAECLII